MINRRLVLTLTPDEMELLLAESDKVGLPASTYSKQIIMKALKGDKQLDLKELQRIMIKNIMKIEHNQKFIISQLFFENEVDLWDQLSRSTKLSLSKILSRFEKENKDIIEKTNEKTPSKTGIYIKK